MDLHVDDSVFTLFNTVISGFSLSCGDGNSRRRVGSSLSLNFTALSQKTTSTYRRPVDVPSGISQNGIRQPHHDFRAIGPVIFSYLSQQDLWNCARVCVLWLHCANDKSLQKQRTHEWSYDLSTSACTLDGFKLPKLTKSDDNNRGYGNNDDEDVTEEEKKELKAKEEVEQAIIREDLKQSPFSHLFPSKKAAPPSSSTS